MWSPHPAAGLRRLQPWALLTLAVLLAIPSLGTVAEPAQKAVAATVEIPAQGWKGIRMRKLPAGARLDLKIASDGDIVVQLLDADAFEHLPLGATPLVSGRTDTTLSLSTRVPSSGEWYVVLDNRKGSAARSVKVDITATAPTAAQPSGLAQGDAPQAVSLDAALSRVERALRGTFVIDALRIDTADCGSRNAYAAPGRIVLCNEYLRALAADSDKDSKKFSDVLLFVLMHEAAHVLLDAWDLPLRGNEEAADELAAVLMIMFGQEDRLPTVASYFDSLPNGGSAAPISARDARHLAPPQRSRNLRTWLADPELPRRWQIWLVPHMQTALLRQLERNPRPWTVAEAIKAELAARE